jgi:basic membrane protein A
VEDANQAKEDRLNTKRWGAIAVVLGTVAAAMVGCGSSGGSSGCKSDGTATNGKVFKVGLVTDTGGLNDKGFNMLANLGVTKANKDLGVACSVKEAKKDTDYVPFLEGFAKDGYDLVISNGFLMADATAKVAKAYPNVRFAIIDSSAMDFSKTPPVPVAPNLTGLIFKEQEAGYLVGVLAATLSKEGATGFTAGGAYATVGGKKIPPVDHYIAGFQAGVTSVDPAAKLINGYSDEFTAQDKCKALAQSQIAQGADVIFQVAGGCGLGALAAADEKGLWGIGVDTDQSAINKHVLASAIKRVDTATFNAAKGVIDGSLPGGADLTFGLANDGVGIEGINAAASATAKTAVDKAIADIKAGTVTPPSEVK